MGAWPPGGTADAVPARSSRVPEQLADCRLICAASMPAAAVNSAPFPDPGILLGYISH